MADVIDIDLPASWWPDRLPDEPYVLLEADDLMTAIVAHADRLGRFYGDPLLLAGLFWKQQPPIGFVTACLYELIDRGDLSMHYAAAPFAEMRPIVLIEHRQRFDRYKGRQWVPLDVRREVLERDGHRCVECGATETLSLDHIVPYSHGGPDTVENLRVLCRPCNSRKGNRV